MRKVISFSLWGDKKIYTVGAIRNAQLAMELYPGWQCRYYIGRSVPNIVVEELKSYPNTELVEMDTDGSWHGMFWRFYPASESDIDIFISRDCDSRLSQREVAAVNEWLRGPKLVHIMRDHPYHTAPIMGGMFGMKKFGCNEMKDLITQFKERYKDEWQCDQDFLRDIIWPRIIHKSLAHDNWGRFSQGEYVNFGKRIYNEFVGSIVNELELPAYPEHHELVCGK